MAALSLLLALSISNAPSGKAQSETFMRIEPRELRVEPGQQGFEIEVHIDAAEDLAAFQFTLNYPPTLLSYRSIEVGDFLGQTGRDIQAFPPVVEAGRMTYVVISSDDGPGVTGDGLLARLRFDSTGEPGQARLSLDEALVTDATNQNRQRVDTEDGLVLIEEEGFRLFAPLALQGLRIEQLPPPLPLDPPSGTPTSAATTVATTEPTPTTPSGSATAHPSPTGEPKPWPEIGELQCYGRTEYITVVNNTGDDLDVEDWSIRSTQGGETYWIDVSLVLAPGEALKIFSGPGSPREETRLEKVWDRFQRWNDAGDSAELYSPRPDRVIRDTMDCPPPAD